MKIQQLTEYLELYLDKIEASQMALTNKGIIRIILSLDFEIAVKIMVF